MDNYYLTNKEGGKLRQIDCRTINELAYRALKLYLKADKGQMIKKLLKRIDKVCESISMDIDITSESMNVREKVCELISIGAISTTMPSIVKENKIIDLNDETKNHMIKLLKYSIYNTWHQARI